MALVLPSLPRQTGLFASAAELMVQAYDWLTPARRSSARGETTPSPRTPAEQWIRLSAVLTTAVTGAEQARNLQGAATQQLELAQYGISTLLDELSAVMKISNRRESKATLHVLGSPAATETGADAAFAELPGRRAWAA